MTRTAPIRLAHVRLACAAVLVLGCCAAPAWAATCDEAADAAERQWGLPHGLLRAIGRVETGRPAAGSGQLQPWPWSTNAGGQGRMFGSADEALRWTEDALAKGNSRIDVGCFQINLAYHPEAFATLEAAFDATANAGAAASFLQSLRSRTGTWDSAIAAYHSSTPALGEPYLQRVMAHWRGLDGAGPAPAEAPPAAPQPAPVPDRTPRIIRLGPAAPVTLVVLRGGAGGTAESQGPAPAGSAGSARVRITRGPVDRPRAALSTPPRQEA